MIWRTSLVLVLALAAEPALAKNKKTKKTSDDDTSEAAAPSPSPSYVYGAAAELGVIGSGGAFGVEVWRNAPNLQYGLQLLGSNGETKGGDDKDENGDALREYISHKAVIFGAKARKSFGGTFYLTGAGSYASYSGTYGFEANGNKVVADYKGGGFWLTFGLGNQWRLNDQGLTIGCDWIGLGALVGSHVTVDTSTEEGQTVDAFTHFAFNQGVAAQTDKTLQKLYSVYILLLSVGAQF